MSSTCHQALAKMVACWSAKVPVNALQRDSAENTCLRREPPHSLFMQSAQDNSANNPHGPTWPCIAKLTRHQLLPLPPPLSLV
eukprot:9029535-Lingulodinium_polyedra.AAC.2